MEFLSVLIDSYCDFHYTAFVDIYVHLGCHLHLLSYVFPVSLVFGWFSFVAPRLVFFFVFKIVLVVVVRLEVWICTEIFGSHSWKSMHDSHSVFPFTGSGTFFLPSSYQVWKFCLHFSYQVWSVLSPFLLLGLEHFVSLSFIGPETFCFPSSYWVWNILSSFLLLGLEHFITLSLTTSETFCLPFS